MEPNNNNQAQFQTPLYRQSLDYLFEHLCTHFQPHEDYFAKHQSLVIRRGQPQFNPTISKNHRNNLQPDRQIKYLRRVVNSDICPEMTKEFLNQKKYEPYRRKGNMSALWKGELFWVQESALYKMKVDMLSLYATGGPSPQIMPAAFKIYSTNEIIYEVKISGIFLLMRSARQLFIYDLSKMEPVKIHVFEVQIVAIWDYLSSFNHYIFLTLYDGERSTISKINLQKQQDRQDLIKQLPEVICSGWALTKNEHMLCKQTSVDLYDCRAGSIKIIYQVKNKTNIFAGIPIEGVQSAAGTFVLSQSHDVKVFDIRKTSEQIFRIDHYCQEAPPTVLQHIEMEIDSNIFNYIVGHSPYPGGSALIINCDHNLINKPPCLLYDSGKIDPTIYPASISILQIQKQLNFFHLDSQGGISLEAMRSLTKDTRPAKQGLLNPILEKISFSGGQSYVSKDGTEEWLNKQNIKKMVKEKQLSFWENELQVEEQLAQQPSFPAKRYLRYCDLRHFYSKLMEKADQKSLNQTLEAEKQLRFQVLKNEGKIEMSMGSTLANFSQNEFDEGGSLDTDCLRMNQLIDLNNHWNSE